MWQSPSTTVKEKLQRDVEQLAEDVRLAVSESIERHAPHVQESVLKGVDQARATAGKVDQAARNHVWLTATIAAVIGALLSSVLLKGRR